LPDEIAISSACGSERRFSRHRRVETRRKLIYYIYNHRTLAISSVIGSCLRSCYYNNFQLPTDALYANTHVRNTRSLSQLLSFSSSHVTSITAQQSPASVQVSGHDAAATDASNNGVRRSVTLFILVVDGDGSALTI
jgi:hypothetical protein